MAIDDAQRERLTLLIADAKGIVNAAENAIKHGIEALDRNEPSTDGQGVPYREILERQIGRLNLMVYYLLREVDIHGVAINGWYEHRRRTIHKELVHNAPPVDRP